MNKVAAIILGAGSGTRMRSRLPKILHPVAGRPLVAYVLEAVRGVPVERVLLVVGQRAALVRERLGEGLEYVEQPQPLGTGHALLQARAPLGGAADTVMVLYGDTPLLTPETLRRLLEQHRVTQACLTLATAFVSEPAGLGRVLRDSQGGLLGVVEEAEAAAPLRQSTEINAGFYCFEASWLWPRLAQLQPSATAEYYLTDLIGVALREGQGVTSLCLENPTEALGVNHRLQLAQAEALIRERIRVRHMLGGVTLVDPASTFIDADVEIGEDTVLYPQTTLAGASKIGRDCGIGPQSLIVDSTIGDQCRVLASVVEGALVEEQVSIGPFSHLRPGSHIARGVHIGNFAEVKKSYLGPGTRMGHFSYIGDATVGRNVNIGAGTITCNYDGTDHHETHIGDDAFIGSDTMLVAPVRLGKGAKTGAGSVVTRDVPPDTLVYGVPAHPAQAEEAAPQERPQGGAKVGSGSAEGC